MAPSHSSPRCQCGLGIRIVQTLMQSSILVDLARCERSRQVVPKYSYVSMMVKAAAAHQLAGHDDLHSACWDSHKAKFIVLCHKSKLVLPRCPFPSSRVIMSTGQILRAGNRVGESDAGNNEAATNRNDYDLLLAEVVTCFSTRPRSSRLVNHEPALQLFVQVTGTMGRTGCLESGWIFEFMVSIAISVSLDRIGAWRRFYVYGWQLDVFL